MRLLIWMRGSGRELSPQHFEASYANLVAAALEGASRGYVVVQTDEGHQRIIPWGAILVLGDAADMEIAEATDIDG